MISLQCFLYVTSFSLVWTLWAICNTAQFNKKISHSWTNPRYPDFEHKKTNESLWLNDTWIFCPMGESPVGSKGTMQCTLQHFSTVCKACKVCQVWSMSRNIVSFWAIAYRGHCSRHHVQVYEHMKEGPHFIIIWSKFELDAQVGSSLVDMCAKYASLKDAFSI